MNQFRIFTVSISIFLLQCVTPQEVSEKKSENIEKISESRFAKVDRMLDEKEKEFLRKFEKQNNWYALRTKDGEISLNTKLVEVVITGGYRFDRSFESGYFSDHQDTFCSLAGCCQPLFTNTLQRGESSPHSNDEDPDCKNDENNGIVMVGNRHLVRLWVNGTEFSLNFKKNELKHSGKTFQLSKTTKEVVNIKPAFILE